MPVEPPTEKRQARIVLLGYGAINRRVATLLQSRASAAIIVGVMVKRPQSLWPLYCSCLLSRPQPESNTDFAIRVRASFTLLTSPTKIV